MTRDSRHTAAGVRRAVSAQWTLPGATLQVADRAGVQIPAPHPLQELWMVHLQTKWGATSECL